MGTRRFVTGDLKVKEKSAEAMKAAAKKFPLNPSRLSHSGFHHRIEQGGMMVVVKIMRRSMKMMVTSLEQQIESWPICGI